MVQQLTERLLDNIETALTESGAARTPDGQKVLDAIAAARTGDWKDAHKLSDSDFGSLLGAFGALSENSPGAADKKLRELSTLPNASYEALIIGADCAIAINMADTALSLCDAALETAPHAPRATLLRGWALSALGDVSGAIDSLRRATLLQPDFAEAHHMLADELRNANMIDGAIEHYRRALTIDPADRAVEKGLETALAAAIPPWQMPMLNDAGRNAAFDAAIRRAVKPGMQVLDIGTGTGLLAMMAARAGAEHVTAVEQIGALAEAAQKIIADNGYADRIAVLHKSSDAVEVGADIPAPADLLVAEIVDAGLLAEGALKTFAYANKSLLKPDAATIPEGATLIATPVESAEIAAMFHCDEAAGFNMSAYRDIAPKLHLQADLHRIPWQPLARPVEVFTFDFRNPPDTPQETEHRIIPLADGTAAAIAFWFVLKLDDEITISTGPEAAPTHWQQAVAPLSPPVDLCQNQPVRLIASHDLDMARFEIKD